MRLAEFIKPIIEKNLHLPYIDNLRHEFLTKDAIPNKMLHIIKEQVQELDEFENCRLLIPNSPSVQVSEDPEDHLPVQSMILKKGMKFKGKCFLYDVYLNEAFVPQTFKVEPSIDGCGISNIYYDERTFASMQNIVMSFINLDLQSNMDTFAPITSDVTRKELHDKLDAILDNPEHYRSDRTYSISVRGIFDVETEGEKNELITIPNNAKKIDDMINTSTSGPRFKAATKSGVLDLDELNEEKR